MTADSSNLIVILGTGRSGTSAAARMTRVFGYELGERLTEPDDGNPTGYFEDADLVDIDMALLAAFGLVEYAARPFDRKWLENPMVRAFERRAEAWLRSRLEAHPRFVMKDPRVTLLLPFWRRVFEQVGVNPRYVFAHRDPMASAVSQKKMLPKYSHNRLLRRFLWQMLEVADVGSGRLVITDFERMLNNPESVTREVAETLGLSVDDSELTAFNQFISPSGTMRDEEYVALKEKFHPVLAALAEHCHRTLSRGTDPKGYWADVEGALDMLRQVLTEGIPGSKDVLWVTQANADVEQPFDKQLHGLSTVGLVQVLFVKIGDAPFSEIDQQRMHGFVEAGCRLEVVLANNAHQAAVNVKNYVDDVKGLFGLVRVPDLNGLGAYVSQDECSGVFRRDEVGAALQQLDEQKHPLDNSDTLVRAALERLARQRSTLADTPAVPPGQSPLVTVCITHRGNEQGLEQSLLSAMSQTYRACEVIVATEDADLAKRGQSSQRIDVGGQTLEFRVIGAEGGTEGVLRNAAGSAAKGEYLLFLKEGDMLVIDAVDVLVDELVTHQADMGASAAYHFAEGMKPTEFSILDVEYPVGPEVALALFMNPYGSGAMLCKTSLVRAIPYLTDCAPDVAVWTWCARALLRLPEFALTPRVLLWHVTEQQCASSNSDQPSLPVLQSFLEELPSKFRNLARYAQGQHFHSQDQARIIKELEQDNQRQAALIEDAKPVFDRGDLIRQETFMRATEIVESPALPLIEVVVLLPEVPEAQRGRSRVRLRQSLASLASQWRGGDRVSVVDANVEPVDPDCASRGEKNYFTNDGAVACARDRLIGLLNDAVNASEAEWVFPVYAGDTLEPDALYRFQELIAESPDAVFAYSDEIALKSDDGARHRSLQIPLLKSDFNAVKLRGHAYTGASIVYRRQALIDAGGFAGGELAAAFDFDMALKLGEAGEVLHLAEPVFKRLLPARSDSHSDSFDEAFDEAALCALRAHLPRTGSAGTVQRGAQPGYYRVDYPASEDTVAVVIWAHEDISRVQASLENVVGQLPAGRVQVYMAHPRDASEPVAHFMTALEAEPAIQQLGVKLVGPVETFGDIARCIGERYAVFLNEGAQIADVEVLDRMVGVASDWQAAMIAPNIITSIDGASVYHSTGCSPLLKHDEQEGRLFAGFSLEQPVIAEGFDRLDLLDFWVMAPSLDAFGFDVNRVGEIALELPVDIALPARLSLTLEKATGSPVTVHVATNVFVMPTQELQAAEGREPYMPGSLSESQLTVYETIGGMNDHVTNKNASAYGYLTFDESGIGRFIQTKRSVPRIIAHPADNFGCGEVRIRSPLRCMKKLHLIDGALADRQMPLGLVARSDADSLVFQRQVEEPQVERISRIGRCYPNIFKVYEIDDLLHQTSTFSPHNKEIRRDVLMQMKKAIQLCDRLVAATEPLAEAYGQFASDVRVVHNTIELARWECLRNKPRLNAKRPRVGWAGSVSHAGDLLAIKPLLEKTSKHVDWVLFGLWVDDLAPYIAEYHSGVDVNEYPDKLASLELDLAIAPLEKIPFNQAKSHLKILEYGVLGIPVIATDITPYNHDRFPIDLVSGSSSQWVEAVMERIKDREALQAAGCNLRNYVIANWSTEGQVNEWASAWTA